MEHKEIVKRCDTFLENYICDGGHIYVFDENDNFINRVVKTITDDGHSKFVTLGSSLACFPLTSLPAHHVKAIFTPGVGRENGYVSLYFEFERAGTVHKCKPVEFVYDVL